LERRRILPCLETGADRATCFVLYNAIAAWIAVGFHMLDPASDTATPARRMRIRPDGERRNHGMKMLFFVGVPMDEFRYTPSCRASHATFHDG
jgi:hypothetical protein